MKEILENRLKVVFKALAEKPINSPEHGALVGEMAAITKLLAEYEKDERDTKANLEKIELEKLKLEFDKEKFYKETSFNKDKLEFEKEKLEREASLNEDKLDLEERKFTQEKAEKIVEVEQEKEKKWWERGLIVLKLVLRGIELGLAVIALKYEIFNHISGKADWEAIRSVFRGE